MKRFLITIILLLFTMLCFSQARARATVSVNIINIEDTAKYTLEQAEIKQRLIDEPLIIKKGDTKSYLNLTFKSPDKIILMSNDYVKEVWLYGNLMVYINDGIVENIRIVENKE